MGRMKFIIVGLVTLLIGIAIVDAEESDMSGMTDMQMDEHGLFGGYSWSREASGTSWQPESTPMAGLHFMPAGWVLMLHGYADAVYDHQGSPRGGEMIYSPNMVMLLGQHQLGGMTLGMKTMFSAEPITIGKDGYPLLFQSGETANGKTELVDRQHPHDLFGELAASLSFPLTEVSSAFVYAGLPGEPALGPPAYMHRLSGQDFPEVPLSHHWMDSTHISFGVVTLGWVYYGMKIDASAFNGHEPDQYRYDIESPQLNSYCGRLSINPSTDLAGQLSWGYLSHPDKIEHVASETRAIASLSYNMQWGEHNWQTTFAWARKDSKIEVTSGPLLFLLEESTNAVLLESALNYYHHNIFARGERVLRNDLLPFYPYYYSVDPVAKLSIGYRYDFELWKHLLLGFGGMGSLFSVPQTLRQHYGESPRAYMLNIKLSLG